MKKHDWFDNIWSFKHFRKGKLLWEHAGRNDLVDQGEEAILEVFFRGVSSYIPSEFYLRLCNDTLAETDALTNVLNEPSGNGYSAQLLERSTVGFPTKEQVLGDYRLVSKEITFTASGGQIGPITTAYLATTQDNSGSLIAFKALPISRTILDGDSMIVQLAIKLS